MNQQQKNYACDRIRAMRDRAKTSIRRKCTTPSIKLTQSQQVDLVLSGSVTINKKVLREGRSGYRTLYLSEIFNFSAHEKEQVFDEKQYERLYGPVKESAQKALDEIMLGDSEVALNKIRDFEKKIKKFC